MKNSKAIGLIAILSLVSLAGCNTNNLDMALITDVGNIDDGSFNQYTYAGVQQYATEFKKSQAYFRPTEDSTQARVDSINAAIKKGAKMIVCPGYLFESAIYNVQDLNPTVSFMLLDGEPHTEDYKTYKTSSNVHNVLYKEQEAGYLAGYAVVKEGYRSLGFMGGMAVPAVEKYGFGYVSGIVDAANELNVDITVKYDYAGTFNASDALVTTATGWYNAGTEAIFSCGGSIFKSISSAATATNKKVIGVDVDQYSQAPSVVITSAEKMLQKSTYESLKAFYGNSAAWPSAYSGKTARVGAAEGMVGLPTDGASWTFKTFTKDAYTTLFAALSASATYTKVDYGTTVTYTPGTTSTAHAKMTYGSGVTNKPIA